MPLRSNLLPKLPLVIIIISIIGWDSIAYGVFHQAAVYAFDGEMKLFDPLCAELFSECDFGGDSITVCDRNPDLPAGGWSKPVKSVSVPARRVLYLFNKEKYGG